MTHLSSGSLPDEDESLQTFLDFVAQCDPECCVGGLIESFRDHLMQRMPEEEVNQTMANASQAMRSNPEAWAQLFDKVYTAPAPAGLSRPNQLVQRAIEGVDPGTALDVAMGQGRNSVFLATRGWEVTGVDISSVGLAQAAELARSAGTEIKTVKADIQSLDFGDMEWDLMVFTYTPVRLTEPAVVERIHQGLSEGGLLVIESFASEVTASYRRPVDIDPGHLRGALTDFHISVFEDEEEVPDWDTTPQQLVRAVARKSE